MRKKITLLTDAAVNFFLGIMLLAFNPGLSGFFGVPGTDLNFYPNILGAVFIGITIALVYEAYRKKDNVSAGLGLTGAVCINLCGGIVLTLWLIFGRLNLPVRGQILLWVLAAVLLVISVIELVLKIKMMREKV